MVFVEMGINKDLFIKKMKIKNIFITILSLLLVLIFGSKKIDGNSTKSPVLNGPYLGQKLPGNTPKLFAPGIISTNNQHSSVYFTEDGLEVYFSRFLKDSYTIYYMKEIGGKWSKPKPVRYLETKGLTPFLSPDGKLLFCSLPRDLYIMKRTVNGWSKPQNMGKAINFQKRQDGISISLKGTLVYCSMFGKRDGMYYTKKINGKYQTPKKLDIQVRGNRLYGYPFIAPDESYIIFQSWTGGFGFGMQDLYISFKKKDGVWSSPVNLGKKINTGSSESFPYVTPDGKYFFFNSNRPSILNKKRRGQFFGNIYWMSSSFIKDLKDKHLK
jgi:hypothetical protein